MSSDCLFVVGKNQDQAGLAASFRLEKPLIKTVSVIDAEILTMDQFQTDFVVWFSKHERFPESLPSGSKPSCFDQKRFIFKVEMFLLGYRLSERDCRTRFVADARSSKTRWHFWSSSLTK